MRDMIDVDSWQFGLVPGRGTTKYMYIAANKPLYFAFVDVEKACGRVSRKVLW